MEITWIGHSCFLIVAADGTRLITDPYEPGFRGLISYDPVDEAADIVTISHEHGDHNYVQAVSGNPIAVRGSGRHTARDLQFTGVPAFHDKVSGAERGPNTVFAFTVDRLRICHLGDLGHGLSQQQRSAIGPVDLLLIPTGGPAATLDIDQANELWRQLAPRVTIPMHFKNSRCSFPRYEVERFLEDKTDVQRLSTTTWQVTKQQLPEQPTIVVLQHAR